MSGWSEVLKQVELRHPFLSHLKVSGEDNFASPLPEVLQFSFDIVEYLRCEDRDEKRLAMVLPLLLDCPEWIATGCALAAIKQDFLPKIECMPPFESGQKLLLDGRYIVEYVGEEKWDGIRFLKVKVGAKRKSGQGSLDTTKLFKYEERLRFQPTDTKKRLSLIESLGIKSDHPIDRLLDLGSFGNRSVFENRVLLVSHLTRVRQFIERTHLLNPVSIDQSVSLRDLFQWGGITVEGDLEQWGHQQIDAEPVIGVVPDLVTLREYLFNRQTSDVFVIIDGDIPFFNDLQALDEILSEGYHVVAMMENRHLDDLRFLEDRGFTTWIWSNHDLRQIELIDPTDETRQQLPFSDFRRKIRNFHTRQIESINCECSELDSAADRLKTYSRQCNSTDPVIRAIEFRFYNVLLKLSRLLRPLVVFDDTSQINIMKELELVLSDIRDNVTRIEKDAVDTAHEFVNLVKAVTENPSSLSGKATELEKLLQNKTRRSQKTAIILADVSEIPLVSKYWKERSLGGELRSIQFLTPATLQSEQDFEYFIVCGWLGSEHMRKIYYSCIAPSISVLTYRFEQTWFQSAINKWHRQQQNEETKLSQQQRAKLLQTKPENLIPVSPKPEVQHPAGESSETDFDITDFELRLHTYRRDLYRGQSDPGDTRTDVRYISFTGNCYSYLRPNYKVPVVTDFIAGYADESSRIPSKDIAQLRVGDYVVFRDGSDSDLLRTIADKGLKKAGKGEHRITAGLWKRELMQFVINHPFGFEGALVELWDAGLKRTEVTVRGWLNDEHRIGPQDERDVEIISQVCRSQQLIEQIDYVRGAIKEVRGAHLQAAHFLAQKLIALIPSILKQGAAETHTIEIEDIGQASVVRIEYIDEEEVAVPPSEVNRLFRNEF